MLDRRAASTGSVLDAPTAVDDAKAHLEHPGAAPRRIFVDLSDTVFHAIWHDTCSGIIRVQLEVAGSLCRRADDVRPFAVHHESFIDLRPIIDGSSTDIDEIFRRLIETYRYDGDRTSTRRPTSYLRYARRQFVRRPKTIRQQPSFSRQDVLYIGGAFWVDPMSHTLAKGLVAADGRLHVLLHDLIPLTHPHFTGHDFRQAYIDMLALPARFIVTGALTRRALEDARRTYHGLAKTESTIVPLADEFPHAARNEPPRIRPPRLGSLETRAFALCVGTIEVRKNHRLLLDTWKAMAATREDLPTLVVAGRKGWKAADTIAILEDSNISTDRILFVEAPTDIELRWLYASCLFTIFPSFFEGWGLPVGESFWFGKPCAISNDSSMTPVARDLCETFSPHDPLELEAAILALLAPQNRQARANAIFRAPLRSWADVAHDIEALMLKKTQVEVAQ